MEVEIVVLQPRSDWSASLGNRFFEREVDVDDSMVTCVVFNKLRAHGKLSVQPGEGERLGCRPVSLVFLQGLMRSDVRKPKGTPA